MSLLSNEARGSLFAIFSGLCYGLVGYLGVTLINSGLSIATMCFWRFGLSSLLCFIFLITQYKQVTDHLPTFAKVFFASSVFFGGDALLYFNASAYIGTGLAVVIFFTYPVFVVLIERVLYKRKVSIVFQAALAIIMLGMWLLVDTKGMSLNFIGILLSITCAMFYAGYIITCKKTKLTPLASTFAITSGCAAMCLSVALLEGSFVLPEMNIASAGSLFAISITCTILPTMLLVKSLKYITSEKASILSVFEPVFIMILGVTLLDEYVTATQMTGASIVLTGAVMTLMREEWIMLPILRIRERLFNIPIPEEYLESEVS